MRKLAKKVSEANELKVSEANFLKVSEANFLLSKLTFC